MICRSSSARSSIYLNSDYTISIVTTNVDPAVAAGTPAATSRKYAIAAQQIVQTDLTSNNANVATVGKAPAFIPVPSMDPTRPQGTPDATNQYLDPTIRFVDLSKAADPVPYNASYNATLYKQLSPAMKAYLQANFGSERAREDQSEAAIRLTCGPPSGIAAAEVDTTRCLRKRRPTPAPRALCERERSLTQAKRRGNKDYHRDLGTASVSGVGTAALRLSANRGCSGGGQRVAGAGARGNAVNAGRAQAGGHERRARESSSPCRRAHYFPRNPASVPLA